MKIVFAFDSFKGSLSATDACKAAVEAANNTNIECMSLPVADGGEGTTLALTKALGGTIINETTAGPLPGTTAHAFFGWCETQQLAVVEMAAASGLTLLEETDRNPLLTSTFGTGELLLRAAGKNPKRVLLGVGGSATVDGGTGAARALGWQFIDKNGKPVPEGGGALNEIERIVAPDNHGLPPVEVLCDVTNPLTGPNGAARTFGPQKGANEEAVRVLEVGMCHLASLVKVQLGLDIDTLPGGGAAGGLAAGAMAWMNARLVPGIDCVLDTIHFDDACRDADWIVTGEGKFDSQSLHGKVISGILARVKKMDRSPRVAVIAGAINLSRKEMANAGFHYADVITPDDMSFDSARKHAQELMRDAVIRFTSTIQNGK